MKSLNIKIAFVFIWLGFIGAISFMEAWLKFQAPGATLEICLSIGDLVFSALNKVELVCATVVIFFSIDKFKTKNISINFIIVLLILLVQTFLISPKLSERVALIVNHQPVEDSYLHLYFVVSELTKTIFLLIYGFKLLKNKNSV